MRRILMTIIGLAAVAIAAVLFAKGLLRPKHEEAQRNQDVLTHAYKPNLVECSVLEDLDLPKSLRRPGVDEDLLYILVVLLYPGVERVPSPKDHRLFNINGQRGTYLDPAHIDLEIEEDGAYLSLVYQTNNAFRYAGMVLDKQLVFDKIELE